MISDFDWSDLVECGGEDANNFFAPIANGANYRIKNNSMAQLNGISSTGAKAKRFAYVIAKKQNQPFKTPNLLRIILVLYLVMLVNGHL